MYYYHLTIVRDRNPRLRKLHVSCRTLSNSVKSVPSSQCCESSAIKLYLKGTRSLLTNCRGLWEWKCKMLNPSVWGAEFVLHLESNLLQVDIHIIPESSCNKGVTVIKPLQPPINQKQPINLFFFADSNFSPAHYQTVWPSSLLPSQNFEVTDLADLTDLVACRYMQIVVVDQPR